MADEFDGLRRILSAVEELSRLFDTSVDVQDPIIARRHETASAYAISKIVDARWVEADLQSGKHNSARRL